ncbi:MAG: efflux RND transporter periplasmic adaptor subunit [Deltaproteobacteria bacterium]|nr:efflux RND transporter periplasmic adaptor subunit [Deltaproteobacteria bacterium]
MVAAMKGKQRFIILTTLIIAFVLSFIAADAEEKVEAIPPVSAAVPIETMTVQAQDLPIVIETVGRIRPDREVLVSAEIPGKIENYGADVGDRVTKGQLLVQVEPTDYRLALREAETNLSAAMIHLSAARKAYGRFQTLLPKKVVSQDNFDKIEAEFEAAQARKEQAEVGVAITRERLAKADIRAPFSGIVAKRHIEKGQWIATGMPVMSILDLSRVRARVFLTERDFVHIDRKDPVKVVAQAYPEKPLTGSIDRIDIEADTMTNTFGVEILVDNPATILKAGMSVRTSITALVLRDIILIPQNVVIFRDRGTEVFIVGDDGRAEVRAVKLGRRSGNLIQVTEGLGVGDRLIVKGQNYVKPGTVVAVSSTNQ